ncbi:hypothetical protein LCGC14_0465640 [marine sediment metagenome]|uniref:DNA methylase N-4/N-6 domain-containing protein n=1 Tax=marine sediment metagenome TaxID=412755 RepID=A0A0F9SDS3_9ZZZZ
MEQNKLIQGDCIEEMNKLEENSVDAIITDPPYGIGFMGKEWDNFKPEHIQEAMENDVRPKKGIASTRTSNTAGTYDLSLNANQKFQLWFSQVATECLRVLKPGGFLLSFGGTRTYHRLVCGIEDAGFEIRDTIMWLYGSGFPKSLNIGKQIDKIQGNEREVIGEKIRGDVEKSKQGVTFAGADANKNNKDIFGYGKEILTKGNSEWEGWGTAFKPACEPIVVARKPLSEKNVALNILKWGTGGINIDESRIGTEERTNPQAGFIRRGRTDEEVFGGVDKNKPKENVSVQGRFPANIILDEEAGKMLDEQAPLTGAFAPVKSGQKGFGGEIYGKYESGGDDGKTFHNEKLQGASRFFYCAKASKSERNYGCEELEKKEKSGSYKFREDGSLDGKPTQAKANTHPTVKPIKLMEYLVKLISKKGATILDPFLGSGTTAIACLKNNRKFIGIEKENEYVKISNARIKPYLEQRTLMSSEKKK